MSGHRLTPPEIEARIVAALAAAPGPLSVTDLWQQEFGLELDSGSVRTYLKRLSTQGRVSARADRHACHHASWKPGETIRFEYPVTVYSLNPKGQP